LVAGDALTFAEKIRVSKQINNEPVLMAVSRALSARSICAKYLPNQLQSFS